MTRAMLVICTCSDEAVAGNIAGSLVRERLAACVTRTPGITSTYWWQGGLQTDAEILLLVKTTSAAFPRLEARIRELHPAKVPEIIAVEIDAGSASYLDWIAQNVHA
jgi:periplasmic divalent cation tolerance protein